MVGDVHNSNFMAGNICTQALFFDKIVYIGNFSEFEDASGNAASSVAACMMSVIMMWMKCLSIGVRSVIVLRCLTLLDCVNKRENCHVHQVNTVSFTPSQH